MARCRGLSEAERLARYFRQLRNVIPEPPKDWMKSAKECKYLKLLQERNKSAT